MENLSVDDVDDVVDGGGRDQCEECNYDVPPVICSYNTPLSRQTPDHSFLASCNFKSIPQPANSLPLYCNKMLSNTNNHKAMLELSPKLSKYCMTSLD